MKSNRPRQKARPYAMQAVYQWQFSHTPVEFLLAQYMKEMNLEKVDFNYFKEIVEGVIKEHEKIDQILKPQLDRELEELNPVELSILRLAVYELLFRVEIPYRVVINEALQIAKKYGSDQGYKYVNAVLDSVWPSLRPHELESEKPNKNVK